MVYYYATTFVCADTGERITGGYSTSTELYNPGDVIETAYGNKIIIEFQIDEKTKF